MLVGWDDKEMAHDFWGYYDLFIDLLNQGLTAAMLGSANLGPSYFNCDFFDIYPIVTKLCTPFLEDNRNNCCKFGRVLISTSGFIRHLILCPELLHVFRSVTHTALLCFAFVLGLLLI